VATQRSDANDEGIEFDISPQPSQGDREAILAAVRELLRREADIARPSVWRLSGWVSQRTGITDLGRWTSRRWHLSARLPWGGRVFPGMNGRGDAK
jgi:hypothetical protein